MYKIYHEVDGIMIHELDNGTEAEADSVIRRLSAKYGLLGLAKIDYGPNERRFVSDEHNVRLQKRKLR